MVAALGGNIMFLGAGPPAGTTTQTPVPVGNPLGLAGAPLKVATAIAYTGLGLHFASLPAALVCLVLRFRSSVGTERQQLRWVVAGAEATVVLLLLPLSDLLGPWKDSVAVLCVPVSVGVAVLRYRLWDPDRLVSPAPPGPGPGRPPLQPPPLRRHPHPCGCAHDPATRHPGPVTAWGRRVRCDVGQTASGSTPGPPGG